MLCCDRYVIFKRYALPVANCESGPRTSFRPARTTTTNNPKICGTSSPFPPSSPLSSVIACQVFSVRFNHCRQTAPVLHNVYACLDAYSVEFENFPNVPDDGYGTDEKNKNNNSYSEKSTDHSAVIRFRLYKTYCLRGDCVVKT